MEQLRVNHDIYQWLKKQAANASTTVDDTADIVLRNVMTGSEKKAFSYPACDNDDHRMCPATSLNLKCACSCHSDWNVEDH